MPKVDGGGEIGLFRSRVVALKELLALGQTEVLVARRQMMRSDSNPAFWRGLHVPGPLDTKTGLVRSCCIHSCAQCSKIGRRAEARGAGRNHGCPILAGWPLCTVAQVVPGSPGPATAGRLRGAPRHQGNCIRATKSASHCSCRWEAPLACHCCAAQPTFLLVRELPPGFEPGAALAPARCATST